MSLVKKYLLSNINYKHICACSYLFNDNRLKYAQYYTFLNNPAIIQSRVFKCKRIEEDGKRFMSVLQSLKETNFHFTTRIKKFAVALPTYIPFLGGKYRKIGYLWFQTLDELNPDDFFTLLNMPDTFYSRFQIIELHVWMLLYHLPKEDRIDKIIRYGVIEAMWEDSQKRAKMVADINKNYKQNFKDLYGEFLLSQLLYDYSFIKSDTALTSAVWNCFFNKDNVNPRTLEALVCYIRYQMHHLNRLNWKMLNGDVEKSGIWAPARPELESVLNKF